MTSNMSDTYPGRTILVVEDFDDARLLLRTWLERKGFRVFELLKMQASLITHHPDRAGAGVEITALVFSVIVWCLLSSQTVSAQERQCRVKLSDLPQATELKGFRLGMTMDQVRARVPQVLFAKTDAFGVSKTSISLDFDPRFEKSNFQDVRTVSLDFLDGKLTSLWIGYQSTFMWQSVDHFVKRISQSLNLPDAWVSWKMRGQQLRCADFQITVSLIGGSPSFRILDQSAEETLTARRIAKDEKESAREENVQVSDVTLGDRTGKIYYPAGCHPAKEIGETNRVIFKTAAEAERAGYKLAGNCQ